MILAQASASQNSKKRLVIAKKLIEGAAYNMTRNLMYYNRRGKLLTDPIQRINNLTNLLPEAKKVDEVMGLEGQIRKIYYSKYR